MLAEDISRIPYPGDMIEGYHAGSDGLSYSVKGESIVSLVQFGMYLLGTTHDGLIVAKHVALATHRDPKVPKSST
jgi:hypothetical protein